MRVFSKKKFEFTNSETGDKAKIDIAEFGNLPEWVNGDPLFLWAKAEGSLEVFGEDKPATRSRGRGKGKEAEKTEDEEPKEEEDKTEGEE